MLPYESRWDPPMLSPQHLVAWVQPCGKFLISHTASACAVAGAVTMTATITAKLRKTVFMMADTVCSLLGDSSFSLEKMGTEAEYKNWDKVRMMIFVGVVSLRLFDSETIPVHWPNPRFLSCQFLQLAGCVSLSEEFFPVSKDSSPQSQRFFWPSSSQPSSINKQMQMSLSRPFAHSFFSILTAPPRIHGSSTLWFTWI